jgi:hypothetical protein
MLDAAAELEPADWMEGATESGCGDRRGERVDCVPEGLESLVSRPLNDLKGALRNPNLDGFCPLIGRLGSNEGRLGSRNGREVVRTNNVSEQDFRSKCLVYTFTEQTESTPMGGYERR